MNISEHTPFFIQEMKRRNFANVKMMAAINDEFVRKSSIRSIQKNKMYPIDIVINSACSACGIDLTLYKKKTRMREVVYARTLVSVYLQSNSNYSLMVISWYTGERNHSSVLYDMKRFKDFENDTYWYTIQHEFIESLRRYSQNYSILMTSEKVIKARGQIR